MTLSADQITPSHSKPLWLNLAQTYLTLVFPILVVLLAVRLIMTPLFLQIEYSRPGFPGDVYGFTQQDRLSYAPFALNYLFNDEDIDYLGDLTFADGTSLYNVRELRHMRDVKLVTQIAFLIAAVVSAITLILIAFLYRHPHRRESLRHGLRNGALLTLAIIAAIVVVAVFNWEFFFTAFHNLFFEGGTWVFLYSDTLIRLFPEQFWFDAALTIGAITVLTALITLLITRRHT
jgi:integral membrane protein (TIGR01906 family)